MAWTLLLIAGVLEIVWATAMKDSHGFTRLWPSVIGVTVSLASFVMLALALRHLPLGTAYAVWVGIGAVGVTLAGMVYFGETASPARLFFIALVVAGVVGLRVVES